MKSSLYEIRLEGQIGPVVAQIFEGMNVINAGQDTLMVGVVQDQAALYGLLMRIFNLGLVVISLRRLEIGLENVIKLEMER